MKEFSPLLARPAPDNLSEVKFPVWASPKLDGIRAVVRGGRLVSRSLKPIRNKRLAELYSNPEFEGLDGELICGDPTDKDVFNKSTSAVMGGDNDSGDVKFYVFDFITDEPYETRKVKAERLSKFHEHIVCVQQSYIESINELSKFEDKMVKLGYEGIMLRGAGSLYKYGRSTAKEGILLKVKRFEHHEAVVIGMTEMMHNTNTAKRNAVGHMERSSKKEGLKSMRVLGALTVKGVNGPFKGVEFEIGTGYDGAQRREFWKLGDALIGKVVRYKHQLTGSKDKPRFPVFDGFRDADDM